MREVMAEQMKIGQIAIEDIKIDIRSRDEMPQTLLGLKAIYCNDEIRAKVFDLLEEVIPSSINKKTGRPGMELWRILVLGCIRLNCKWDYDKLQDIANQHKSLRMMLGHSLFDDDYEYSLQTLKDNISLFTPEILNKINLEVVNYGIDVYGKKAPQKYVNRESEKGDRATDKAAAILRIIEGCCDSLPVRRNIHFPTDISLLLDSFRKTITLISYLAKKYKLSGWREYREHLRKARNHYHRIRRANHSTSKNEQKKMVRQQEIKELYRQYISMIIKDLERVYRSMMSLYEQDLLSKEIVQALEGYIDYAEKFIYQIEMRVISEEKIPHSEKIFSIFEPDTEWICKGKSGISQELGLNVCIVTDTNGFILHHEVMRKTSDSEIAVKIIETVKKMYPGFVQCSFDKGFHSPENQKKLAEILERPVLPQKGKLSAERKLIERSDYFVKARKYHPAVESAISALKNHGLDFCPDRGSEGFDRYVGLGVLARNIQHLGHLIQLKELKAAQKQKKNLCTRSLKNRSGTILKKAI